jgi:hypothetical protein
MAPRRVNGRTRHQYRRVSGTQNDRPSHRYRWKGAHAGSGEVLLDPLDLRGQLAGVAGPDVRLEHQPDPG